MIRQFFSLVVAWGFAATAGATDGKKPNILFIYTDDQSYKTVGCYPESWPWVKIPHIDALAKTGVRFHGAYLGAWCMPSRASILTGHQPHGIQSMGMAEPYPASSYDPRQCPCWTAHSRKNGYHTAHIGNMSATSSLACPMSCTTSPPTRRR
jgi:arylsulfatase A-like enzyme